jgi:hypothetical protein
MAKKLFLPYQQHTASTLQKAFIIRPLEPSDSRPDFELYLSLCHDEPPIQPDIIKAIRPGKKTVRLQTKCGYWPYSDHHAAS